MGVLELCAIAALWLGLGTKNTWLGLGNDPGMGKNKCYLRNLSNVHIMYKSYLSTL